MLGDEYMPELDPVVEARLVDAAMRMLGCRERLALLFSYGNAAYDDTIGTDI